MRYVRSIVSIIGDGVAWGVALSAMLLVRYSFGEFTYQFDNHVMIFSGLFLLWAILFYIAGLYQPKASKSASELFHLFMPTMVVGTILSIGLFYIFSPIVLITPKTNLLLFIVFFGIFDFAIRVGFIRFWIRRGLRTTVCVIGNTSEVQDIVNHITHNPYLGYDIVSIHSGEDDLDVCDFHTSDAIIISSDLLQTDDRTQKYVYKNILPSHKPLFDSISFYELLFNKVPVSTVKELWFVQKITPRHKMYQALERMLDILYASLVLILFLPIIPFIAFGIKLTSRGPIIYRQTRIGKGGEPFTLYKFRTMREDAELNGAQWAQKRDPRTTAIGKFLRFTHLDELPQLFNIIKGDLSFVGPRPERPEFVAELTKEIPHYDVRHIVKPGLTGWTQINYQYGSSVNDAREKLQYDIYYLKHRSITGDMLIILKTIKFFFFNF
jgi:exopolysaccharide biosynthesis polyprenyl glycosylphosphotransferase